MGLPVTVYRYTDAGAPQLTNGTPSEWINILKKVLVEGYGSKSPLGWTLEFENAGAYKAAFRNSVADGGSGGYVQFWSSTGANAVNTGMNFQSAASMSALDTFVKPGYGRQLIIQANVRGWEIIGTSRGFYISSYLTNTLLIGHSSASNQFAQTYFIGDIAGSNGFTIVSGTSSTADVYSTSSTGLQHTAQFLYCRLYAIDGGVSNYLYTAQKSYLYNSNTIDGDAEAAGIDHHMAPLMITGSQTASDVNNVSQNISLVMPFYRGFVPGLYMSSFAGYRTENWPKDLVQGGITWVLLRANYYAGYWIRTGTWYD